MIEKIWLKEIIHESYGAKIGLLNTWLKRFDLKRLYLNYRNLIQKINIETDTRLFLGKSKGMYPRKMRTKF